MSAFNGYWFRDKLIQKQRSQRALARHLVVDASAVTLMFDGRRRMQRRRPSEYARRDGCSQGKFLAGIQWRAFIFQASKIAIDF